MSEHENIDKSIIAAVLNTHGCHLTVEENGDFVVDSPNRTLHVKMTGPLTYEAATAAVNTLRRMALERA